VLASSASAQSIFLVRHAERADAGQQQVKDPELSERGRARAESLAAVLKDAGLQAIYASQYKRTQQTAAPLAKAIDVKVTVVEADDVAGLVTRVQAQKGSALVVSHSDMLPEILKALKIETPIKINADDYDDLFIVTSGTGRTLLRLHYR
jgi:phosphohistidine phosphatase SixA